MSSRNKDKPGLISLFKLKINDAAQKKSFRHLYSAPTFDYWIIYDMHSSIVIFIFIGSDELERWEDDDQTEDKENLAHHIVSRQAPAAQQARNNRVTDSSFSTPSLQELEQPNTGSPVRSYSYLPSSYS